MKTWKEVPHIFANGKFKVIENITGDNVISDLTGIAIVTDGIRALTELGWSAWVKDCTLIARKIDDMTDDEIIQSLPFEVLKDKADPEYIRQKELEKNSYLRSMRMCLYMISIGVYPFDQSHFESSEVIDIKTLEEKQ
jgi:hypothetical protein